MSNIAAEEDGRVITEDEIQSNLSKQTEKPLKELSQNPYLMPYPVFVTADLPVETLSDFLQKSYSKETIVPDLLLLPTSDPKSLVSQLPNAKVSKPPIDTYQAPFTGKSLEDVNAFIQEHLVSDKSASSLIHTEVYVMLDEQSLKDKKTCVLCHNLIEHRRKCDEGGFPYTSGMEKGNVMGARATFRMASTMMGNFSTGNLDLVESTDNLKEGEVLDF
ncbi:MAG: hypothetical protein Q9227_002551 [Pyrenula ochraceoflavens]